MSELTSRRGHRKLVIVDSTESNEVEPSNEESNTYQDNNNDSESSMMENSNKVQTNSNRAKMNGKIVIEKNALLPYNVPEHIIIVYDCAIDEESTKFQWNGSSYEPTEMLKKSLKVFLKNKHSIDGNHKFALVVLNESGVDWLQDFTSDIEKITDALDNVESCEPEDIIILNKLFELINEKVVVPKSVNSDEPPSYVVRVLFTYGRSYTIPKVDFDDEEDQLLSLFESPYFIFDVLMTHEVPIKYYKCRKISESLQQIDRKGIAYFFPVERDATKLFLSMAKLLSHPLQRPTQSVANYRFDCLEA